LPKSCDITRHGPNCGAIAVGGRAPFPRPHGASNGANFAAVIFIGACNLRMAAVQGANSVRASSDSRCHLFRTLLFVVFLSASFGTTLSQTQEPLRQMPADKVTGEAGIPVTDPLVIAKCGACHTNDGHGNIQRISTARTTPEGWQEVLRLAPSAMRSPVPFRGGVRPRIGSTFPKNMPRSIRFRQTMRLSPFSHERHRSILLNGLLGATACARRTWLADGC
jgi:hypothetical protein